METTKRYEVPCRECGVEVEITEAQIAQVLTLNRALEARGEMPLRRDEVVTCTPCARVVRDDEARRDVREWEEACQVAALLRAHEHVDAMRLERARRGRYRRIVHQALADNAGNDNA